jgi:hypothetical protein
MFAARGIVLEFIRPASLSFLTPSQQSGAIRLTECSMSHAQIGGEALPCADHREGGDPLTRFVVFGTRIASAGVTARNPWLHIWIDTWSLGFEAFSVIGLRAMRVGGGGAAAAKEAHRMVSEKIEASLALQAGRARFCNPIPRVKRKAGQALPVRCHSWSQRNPAHRWHCS